VIASPIPRNDDFIVEALSVEVLFVTAFILDPQLFHEHFASADLPGWPHVEGQHAFNERSVADQSLTVQLVGGCVIAHIFLDGRASEDAECKPALNGLLHISLVSVSDLGDIRGLLRSIGKLMVVPNHSEAEFFPVPPRRTRQPQANGCCWPILLKNSALEADEKFLDPRTN
jgi:hypothetical protein